MNAQINAEQLVRKVNGLTGFTRASGVEVLKVEPGVVVMSLRSKPELLQFNGHFHGGVIAGLADHAGGAAATTALPAGKIGVTVDLHVNFLAPAKGTTIKASARTLQVGGTICVVAVEVVSIEEATDSKETLCAVATGTFRVVDMPALAGHR